MKYVERTICLEAPQGLGRKPRPEMIAPIFAHLHGTLKDSVRMGFMHSSRVRGRIPKVLDMAAQVNFSGISSSDDNNTILHFEVAQLGDIAHDLFQQLQLWDDGPQSGQTAFELLGGSILDISQRQMESTRYDLGMLSGIARYHTWLTRGLTSITLTDTDIAGLPRIDEALVRTARELSSTTPQPRRIRIAGKLDLLGVSQRVLKLHLPDGDVVTAVWESSRAVSDLSGLFDRDVVVEGLAVFRPSGTLLRVDADAIDLAGENGLILPDDPERHACARLRYRRPDEAGRDISVQASSRSSCR